MGKPEITVAILTRNRPSLLALTLESILAQQGVKLHVAVLDNASQDNTAEVVQSFQAQGVEYVRNETDIGIIRNWNRGLQYAAKRSPIAIVFHDDDIMLPGYLAEIGQGLTENPSAAFSLVVPQFITHEGEPCGVQQMDGLRDGLMPGLDFLESVVDCRGIDIYPPSVAFNSAAALAAGALDSPHMRGTVDMNFYYRLASQGDVLFVNKELVQCRQHGGSDTTLINREANSTFWYGAVAERIDAVGYLLRSPRSAEPSYRDWLARRLLSLHAHESAAIHPFSAEMYHTWENRYAMLCEHLQQNIPAGEAFVLIDNGELGINGEFNGRKVLPFLQRDGEYWGAPQDSRQAIAELKRMREAGIGWVVLAWPSFWWLDQYGEFGKHLEERHRCKLNSPQALIYQLRGRGQTG